MNWLINIKRELFRKENRQLFLVIAIIAIAVILSRAFSEFREIPKSTAKPTEIPVVVQEVKAEAHRVTITTTGRVAPRNTVAISPQVFGRIEWLNPAMYAGGYFQSGDILFRIETADYENTVARERAEVAIAHTELALERADGKAALEEWQALNGDTPAPDLVSHKPQIAQAEAILASSKARLAQAQLNLSRTGYQLPFAGRVLNSTLELGDYVQTGQRYGETYNNDSLEILVSLPQSDLAWLNPPLGGADETAPAYQISVIIDELNTGRRQVVPATLLRTGATLDNTTRFQEITIKPAAEVTLLPGMLAEVIITGPALSNTWELPLTALQAGNFFWQVDEEQRLRRLPADIIATQVDTLIARALQTSARIVTNPISSGIEGIGVRILNDSSANKPVEETSNAKGATPKALAPEDPAPEGSFDEQTP